MSILIKKNQAGGSLFADPRYLILNADTPTRNLPQAQNNRGGTGRGSKSTGPSTKSNDKDFDGLLPSDIQFYKQEEMRIRNGIAQGFNQNEHFDDTPAYEMLLQDYHKLSSVLAPQMKSMNKIYETSYKKFGVNAAGDSPAIVNGKAIVQVIQKDSPELGKFKTVSVDDLLTNAPAYRLLQGQEVLKQRHNNPIFSGFTKLGVYADQLISTAYGSKLYNADLDTNLKNAGYVKTKGKYKNAVNNQVLNLNDISFDRVSSLVTKSNFSNLQSMREALLSEGATNLNTYLENKSIAFLHNQVAHGAIKIDPKKTSIPEMIAWSSNTLLARKLKTSMIIDENERIKAATTSRSSAPSDTKDKHGNIFMDGGTGMLMNTERITIDNIDKLDPEVANIIHSLPAAYISDAAAYIKYGYGDNVHGDKSTGSTKFNRKTIANNSVIQDMMGGGETDLTIYDQTTIKSLVDNRDLQNATIPENTSVHIILAPTVKNAEGRVVVDFTNKYAIDVMEAIANTYKELKENGISEADLAKGDLGILKKAQDLAQEYLSKAVQGNTDNIPTIRATFALDIQYETDGDSVNLKKAGKPISGDILYSIIDEGWGRLKYNYARETKAFIPISTSFWKKMFKRGSFPARFENKVSAYRYQGVLRTTPIVNLIDFTSIAKRKAAKQYNKKFGGKLISAEDIENLLFN